MTTHMPSRTMNGACGVMEPVAMQDVVCCEIRMEECRQGCKIYCTCDDEATCAALQNLCNMIENCVCSVRCIRDGEMCCECCFDCCDCTCQMLMNGICLCCSTDDKDCMKMIQAMCKCLCCCHDCGCEYNICVNGAPICRCTC